MPLDRLKNKTTTECLWLYILSLMKQGPLYAYEVRERIRKQFGFKIGQVTAYMVLYKLERKGYVKTNWRMEENRQRKYYTITKKGETLLKEGKKYLEELADKL
jgi:DNA-binding PadR family transcriptional regulator